MRDIFLSALCLGALGLGALGVNACALPALSQDDRPCEAGVCVTGYVCDIVSNRCVKPDALSAGMGATTDTGPSGSTETAQSYIALSVRQEARPSEALSEIPVLVVLDAARLKGIDVGAHGEFLSIVDESKASLVFDASEFPRVWVKMPSVASAANTRIFVGRGATPVASANPWTNGFTSNAMLGVGGASYDGTLTTTSTALAAPVSGAATLELEASCPRPSSARAVHLVPATLMDDQQIPLTTGALDLSHLRVSDEEGRTVPYWSEQWGMTSASSTLWLKVPKAGTQTLTFETDDDTVVSSSNASAVLTANGLWATSWKLSSSPSTGNEAQLDAVLAALADGSRAGWGPVPKIDCVNSSCNLFFTSSTNDFVIRFEGWFHADIAGCYTFGIDADDTADLHLGAGNTWTSGFSMPSTLYVYGGNTFNNDPSYAGTGRRATVNLAAGHHRLAFRFYDWISNESYRLAYSFRANCTPNSENLTPVPTERFFYRQRTLPTPGATIDAPVSSVFGVRSGNVSAVCTNDSVMFSVGTEMVTAPWPQDGMKHVLALRADGASLGVFIDGALAQAQTSSASALLASTASLGILERALTRAPGFMDDARLSSVARSDAWIAFSARSQQDDVWTYGELVSM
jgi:Domain of unknown function (DUF2341)